MMQDILQQFAGGAPTMPPEQMYGHVNTMLQQAPAEHIQGAIGDALQGLGPQGFGQSVQQAAQTMGPQQQQGLFGMLGQAIEGGGSMPNVLGSLDLGGSNPGSAGGGYASGGGMSMPQGLGAGGLGQLAGYALQNHGGALTSVLSNQLGGSGNTGGMGGIGGMPGGGNTGGGGGAGVLGLLGNPTVQRVGMSLARRLLSGGGL